MLAGNITPEKCFLGGMVMFCLTQLSVCMKRAGERWPSTTDHPLQKMHPTHVVRLPACRPAGFTPTDDSCVSFILKTIVRQRSAANYRNLIIFYLTEWSPGWAFS